MIASKTKILIICGPTASGKTGLALQLAKELPKANLLSVDSRQAYQGLGILTGKDMPSDLPSSISVYGLDIFSPDEVANLGEFTRYANNVINSSVKSKTPLIIVGGTGLYLKAITEHLSLISIPPDEELRQSLAGLGVTELQHVLRQKDEQKFLSMNRSDSLNPRRLIRAIEIAEAKVGSIPSQNDSVSFQWIGLMPDKITLKENIHQRVLDRLQAGAIAEVQELIKKYPDRHLPIFTSLGVSQICDFLAGKITQDELVDIWTRAEVDYARRQIVWFKKQPGIVWYDKDINREKLVEQLKKNYLDYA